MTPVQFVKARLDEDEDAARDALRADLPARWETEHGGVCTAEPYERPGYSEDGEKIPIARVLGTVGEFRAEMRNAEHIARHDPDRVLAEVEAKRRIVELWERESGDRHLHAEGEARAWLMDEVLQALALPHARHPDYDPAWRPE